MDANTRSAHASRALSAFLSTYLSSQPSLILISSPLFPSPSPGDHDHDHDNGGGGSGGGGSNGGGGNGNGKKGKGKKAKKTWIKTTFPAPVPKPRILRDVTIKDMVIRPPGSPAHLDSDSGLTSLAPSDVRPDDDVSMTSTNWVVKSGTVLAKVVLPKGLDVRLDVRGVLPDLLIFDGAVPPSSVSVSFDGHSIPPAFEIDGHSVSAAFDFDGQDTFEEYLRKGMNAKDTMMMMMIAPPLPPERPLPSPIPPNAFAHIRPGEWLVASSNSSIAQGDRQDRNADGGYGVGGNGGEGDGEEEEEEGSVTYVSAEKRR